MASIRGSHLIPWIDGAKVLVEGYGSHSGGRGMGLRKTLFENRAII